jgi:hypothetical protein
MLECSLQRQPDDAGEAGQVARRPTDPGDQALLSPQVAEMVGLWDDIARRERHQFRDELALRVCFVRLYTLYEQLSGDAGATTTPRKSSENDVARRKSYVFGLLYPRDPPRQQDGSRSPAWEEFSRRLAAARRWGPMAATLGLGVLALLPPGVSNN